MPDVADDASNTIEVELQASLAAFRSQRAPALVPKVDEGTKQTLCHNCECEIEAGKLFCAPVYGGPGLSECQQDYERRVHRRRV